MDKTVQIDEEKNNKRVKKTKQKQNSGACICIHPLCYETAK